MVVLIGQLRPMHFSIDKFVAVILAAKMLKAFGLTVRNEVKLEMLSNRLLDVVEETMEPQSLTLWIRKT